MILGRGATRLSSRELLGELHQTRSRGVSRQTAPRPTGQNPLFGGLSEQQREQLERIRRQK